MHALKYKKNPHLLRLKPYPQIKLSGTPFIKDLFVIQDIRSSQWNHPEFLFQPACAWVLIKCMHGYFRLPESPFLYILTGYNVFRTPLLMLPMHSVFLFYVYSVYFCYHWALLSLRWHLRLEASEHTINALVYGWNLPIHENVKGPEPSAIIRNVCANFRVCRLMGM
jgi:hypothetical protein